MKKTLYIAIGLTIWSVIVLPVGCAVTGAPWWIAFTIGLFSGSAAMMWWIVYSDERKQARWRKEMGYE